MAHIFLYGPSGTGKSTLGEILARNLSLPSVDLDSLIEARAGMPISQLMTAQGESAFRDLETAALKAAIGGPESVIALGGGALLRDENRALAENAGRVILLMTDLDTLLERLAAQAGQRPLLAGDLRAKLTALLEKRAEHYRSFPLRLDAGAAPDAIAWRAQVALGRFHLAAMGAYDVVVQNNGIKQVGELLRARGLKNPLVVTDENVARFHWEPLAASLQQAGFNPKVLILPAGEQHKTLQTIQRLWQGFLEAGLDRKSTVLALGGGVVGDMTGFAAATFMRGVSWVGIPTTLLSMVDASLGGKTGFDLTEGKNLIGAFYPPRLVLADPQTLETLPEAELISGLAEVVKHGVIADPELFTLCGRGLAWVKDNLEEVVRRGMAVKVKVIEEDPYERGFRAALNLGHTVGHAVELVSGFRLRHGEAVSVGMEAEARLSERLTVAGPGLADSLAESLSALGLPVEIPQKLPRADLIRAMRVDKKKNAAAIRFALPAEIGRVELVDVTDLETVLEDV